MRRTSITIGALALVAGCQDATAPTLQLPRGAAALQLEYAVVELPTLLGGSVARAYAINARGQVAGWSDSETSLYTHATRWTNDEPEDLGTLGGPGSWAYAFDINARGDVIGYSTTSSTSGLVHAFRFSDESGMEDLGTIGGPQSFANAINDNGAVVGWSDVVSLSGPHHAFRWTPTAGMQDLGTLPGGTHSYANDISNAGEIVGNSETPAGYRAVLWTKDGELVNLGTLPGGSYSSASAINERGEVVGSSSDAAGNGHAVLWTKSRQIVDLGTEFLANSVNQAGSIVVGSGGGSNPFNPRGFVWTRDEGVRELAGLPGATFTSVEDINHAGTAVGSSGPYYFSTRAVKWVRSQSAAANRGR